MVARIASGKSIRGVLVYNEKKIENAEAQLLMAAGFPRPAERLTFKSKLERFEMLTRQNERTKTNTLHISLNFSRDDSVDDGLLCCIATDYMEAIGFGGQPYLVYRHYDAAHPHVHIATVNIAEGGQRIETHNIGKYQSEKARKSIEERYGLIRAEEQKKEMAYMLKPIDLERVVYGKSETKSAISRTVREIVGSYKFASLSELNAVLRQFNVLANRGNSDSRMYEKGGLTYHLLRDNGQKAGIPIKASSIYGSPTLKNLEKKFGPNKEARKPYGIRIRHLLDKAIAEASDMDDLETRLQQQGIRILLREDAMGNIQGITFIDNGTRSVFNGSTLGKYYGAEAFLQRVHFADESLHSIGQMTIMDDGVSPDARRNDSPSMGVFPASGLPAIQRLGANAGDDGSEWSTADGNRRKQKLKKQQQVE